MDHKIVSRDEWLAARKAHLKNEKALTRLRDLVAAERRALPWVKVEKHYLFDTPDGKKTLAGLFEGAQPADRSPFHVEMGSGSRVRQLLPGGRSRGRRDRPSGESRCDICSRVPGAVGETASLQQADGLEGEVGIVLQQRLQL
jgi:predicted dithiol-disulfide oxidoreductase (DUF899 family)